MKKVLLLLLIIQTPFQFCSKTKYCWTCAHRVTVPNSAASTNNSTQCNMTLDQIRDFEKRNSSTAQVGGITITAKMSCMKQPD